MKVCCKDCKWFVRGTIDDYLSYSDYCKAPELGIIKNYIYGDYNRTIDVGAQSYPNKEDTNGCMFYKPSLWKRIKDYFKEKQP